MVISVLCGRGTGQVEKAAAESGMLTVGLIADDRGFAEEKAADEVMAGATAAGAEIKIPAHFSDSGLRGGMRVY